nr:hypothetical protein OG999_14725 [Streptomyces sp. NBC_00886]
MPTWGLIVETTTGSVDRKHWVADVLAQTEGTREEALVELEKRARQYRPEHPRKPQRTRLFRDGDGFLLVADGVLGTFHTRFSVAELVHDSGAPTWVGPGPEPA